MFVNLKVNMWCNNNIISDSKTNSNYENVNYKIIKKYDYICNCD